MKHEVHVFCLSDDATDSANVASLCRHAATVTAVRLRSTRAKWRALKALVLGGPLSVAVFNECRLHAAIISKYQEMRPDLIIVYSSNVAQYAGHFVDIPRIMQFADLDSLKWGQYAVRARIPLKWIYRIEQQRLLAYERYIAGSFDHSLVCTAIERRDFERLIPGAAVSIVANGVDLEYFRPLGQPKQPRSMVFTGVMDYFPNVDAVCWFCDEIFPLIRQELAGATLTICGSRPNRTVQRLAERKGVTVTGAVPDTRPYLDGAELFVAPIRIARGIQNKVLEAMAMARPVVSSTAAWAGTGLARGEGILTSDDPREFADHAIHLLRDPEFRALMARRGRAALEAHYSWEAQLATLDSIIATVTEGSRVHSATMS